MTMQLENIKAIEDKYGLMVFRMGLVQLVDMGIRNLDENCIAEYIQQITAEEEANKINGITPIITAKLQCEIIYCAAELSKYSPLNLFAYIKKHVYL